MGFPRILSKNNKIYTKLGEFCLSGDSFWIVCHTCQEELQTQDQFWKHIQDEHNFMHGVTKESQSSRAISYCLEVEGAATTSMTTSVGAAAVAVAAASSGSVINLPQLPLYHRKYNEDEHRDTSSADLQEQQRDSKEFSDMHNSADENSSTGGVHGSGINIKLEPVTAALALTTEQQQLTATNTGNTTPTAVYHMPQVVPPPPPPTAATYTSAANATTPQQQNTIMHTTPVSLPALSMAVAPTTTIAAAAAAAAILATQELPAKDSNSTTASASSAVSSEDGERWYVCDYETCGLKFKYMSRLELHRVVHSKERRFICDLCSASFKQSCNLSTHRKKKHALKGVKSTPLPQRF